jgi:cyanophycin synthetase
MIGKFRFAGTRELRWGYAWGLNQATVAYTLVAQAGKWPKLDERLAPLSHRLGHAPAAAAAKAWDAPQRLAYWVGAIQRECRIPVSPQVLVRELGGAAPNEHARFLMVLPTIQPEATECALKGLVSVVNGLLNHATAHDAHAALDALFEKLRTFSEQRTNTYSIWLAADTLGIAVARLTSDTLVLGHGNKARWLKSTITDRTPGISSALARSKSATAMLLRKSGLPGAEHEEAATADDAVRIATRLGYPVVIKPADQEQGNGVAADLRNDAQVRQAYEAARAFSNHILVERHQDGFTHRLTVLHGKVFRVTQRVAGGVTGDGIRSVAELVALEQQKPEQVMRAHNKGRYLLELDEEALGLLAQQGKHADDVPLPNEYVRLRRRDNINAGGRNIKWDLDRIHPDNLRLAEDAAQLMRLDIAGVDLIMTDLARSWREVGGVICEVNAQPQLGPNSHADAYPELLNSLLPNGAHIPVRLLLCSEESAGSIHNADGFVESLLQQGVNALSTRQGLWVDGAWRTQPFANGFEAAEALLLRPDAASAACLMTLAEVWRWGLPTNRLAAAVWVDSTERLEAERARLQTVGSLIAGHLNKG